MILDRWKNQFGFWCPGCDEHHTINDTWNWNGSIDKPTFTPSILTKTGHYADDWNKESCWCTFNAEQRKKGEPESGFKCLICHSYIEEGRIRFLNDCTHALAGQTVDLPVIPETYRYGHQK